MSTLHTQQRPSPKQPFPQSSQCTQPVQCAVHVDLDEVLSDLTLAHELELSSKEAEDEANHLSTEHLEEGKWVKVTVAQTIPFLLLCVILEKM